MSNKEKQVKAWIDNNKIQWDFWSRVSLEGTHELQEKSKSEVDALKNYYEGRYDMACEFRSIL